MNKASGGDGISAELFQILKGNVVKCCSQHVSKFGNLSSGLATGLEMSAFIPIPKKNSAKESSNYHTIVLISYASKIILKILQVRLMQYMHLEHPVVQPGFRKGKGTKDQIANNHWIIEKAREFQKKISASLTNLKPLTVWIKTNCGKFLKKWEYQTTLLVS